MQNAFSRRLSGRATVGRPLREVFPELEGQGLMELLVRVYASGQPLAVSEVPVRWDRDGDGQVDAEGWFNVVYQPIRDEGGVVNGVLSHSIEPRAGPGRVRHLARPRGAAAGDRESRAVDRGGPGRQGHRGERAKPERVDTGALAAEAVDLLAPPSGVVTIAPDMPTVLAERVPLQQVFIYLIGNALKHGWSETPRVEVEWRQREAVDEFTIRDNGPGIAPEFHECIWGIFQTLEARDKVEGTGIGLAVVEKIVESRGGRAWVESAPGAGATFHFTWPRAE